MNKKLLLIPFILSSLLSAEAVNHYSNNYENSSTKETTEDRVISSTAEVSAQITIVVSLKIISEVTSGKDNNLATMSFLDNNRIQITEDIANGKGEHIETLLSMMKLINTKENIEKIQSHFDELIYLGHNDFLNKLKSFV